ncbi:hypothetical protein [Devosia sp.]|uniref:hypothetical protein n=1 Tax=Devosia sp. TaxID=1871048 RepID=UPI001ACC5EF2|nr:hypothetical protein [Devosia sp.]MBN9334912.1 hypothetical protein [Devosia sp.]
MKRRSFIQAIPFVGLGTAVPMAAEAAPEAPNAKVRRLQRELSDALAELITVPVAPADYVSIVFPTGTTKYTRTLIERDVYESTHERELERSIAIENWRAKDIVLQASLKPFDRTRWEFASLDENEARNAMLRTFRGEHHAA